MADVSIIVFSMFWLLISCSVVDPYHRLISSISERFHLTCQLDVIIPSSGLVKLHRSPRMRGWILLQEKLCIQAINRCPNNRRLLIIPPQIPIQLLSEINFQLCDLDNLILVIMESTFNEPPLDHLLNNTYISINCRLIIALGTSPFTYSITEVYQIHKQAMFHHQTNYGYWNPNQHMIHTLKQVTTNIYLQRNDLNGVSIRFGFGELPPLSEEVIEQDNVTIYKGITYLAWVTVMKYLNINVVHVNFGNEFGYRMINGTWTGLIGALQNGKLDMINNMIIVRADRGSIADFLRPILRAKFLVFVKPVILSRNDNSINWTMYTKPFTYYLWVMICITIFLLINWNLILWTILKKFQIIVVNEVSGIFLNTISLFCQQGSSQIFQNPTGRFTYSFSCFLFSLIFFSYASQLISTRVTLKEDYAFNDITSLMDYGGYHIHFHTKSFLIDEIQKSKDPKLCRLYRDYIVPDMNKHPPIIDGLNRVLAYHQYAFVATDLIGRYYFQRRKRFVLHFPVVDNPFLLTAYITKHSPYQRYINHKVLQLKECGLLHRILSEYIEKSENIDKEKDFIPIDLDTIVLPLIILLIGICISILTLIIEMIYHGREPSESRYTIIKCCFPKTTEQL